MTWHSGPLAAFDVESTGVDVESDRIVTATVALIRPGQPTDVRSHLVAVEVDIPQAATEIHGITTEHARANGKPAAEVLDAVAADLADAMRAGVPVVGMNVCFDFTLLDRELRRHGLPDLEVRIGGPVAPVLDVLVIDKQVDRYRRGGRKLTDLCAHYGVALDGAHDSANDALAAARVLWRIGQRAAMPADELSGLYADRRNPYEVALSVGRLAGMDVAALHEAQVGWYREQSASLAQFWYRKAGELEHQAGVAGGGEREDFLAEAEDLRARAGSVTFHWPFQPVPGGGS